MPRKPFIVDLANQRKYRALKSARTNESDVEFYDRRDVSRAAAWRGEERRQDSDVPERIRRDGFAVIRFIRTDAADARQAVRPSAHIYGAKYDVMAGRLRDPEYRGMA